MAWSQHRLTGYAPDLPADAVPAEYWSSLENTTLQDGIQTSSVGDLTNITITGTPITRFEWIQASRTLALESIVYMGVDIAGPRVRLGLYLAATGHTDLTAGAGWAATAPALPNFYTGGAFSTGVLVNVSGYAPAWVDPQTATVTGLPAALRFSALRPYKYMAIGIGDQAVAGAENTVRWSASTVPGAAPTTWTPAAGNDAGSFDISAPTAGQLVDGGQLGEDFIIYGENSAHLMTYVGGATVMANRRLSADTGILARNCWQDIGGAHAVITRDDVVLVNQQGVLKSIATGKVRRSIFSGLYNTDNRQNSTQLWHDRRRGHLYVALPNSTPSDRLRIAWIYEIATDTWSYRQLGPLSGVAINCAGMAGAATGSTAGYQQPQLLLSINDDAALTGQALVLSESNNGTQDAPVTVWRKDDLDLGDASRRKLVRRIRLHGSAASAVSLQVQVGGKDAVDEAYTYGSTFTYDLATSGSLNVLTAGRYISVKVTAANTDPVAVRLMGFDLEYEMQGSY